MIESKPMTTPKGWTRHTPGTFSVQVPTRTAPAPKPKDAPPPSNKPAK